MKQPEAEILARNGCIGQVRIIRSRTEKEWTVFLYGFNGADVATDAGVETARDTRRRWASLDSAQRWLEGLPFPRHPDVQLVWE
jgi:hypothetical protein